MDYVQHGTTEDLNNRLLVLVISILMFKLQVKIMLITTDHHDLIKSYLSPSQHFGIYEEIPSRHIQKSRTDKVAVKSINLISSPLSPSKCLHQILNISVEAFLGCVLKHMCKQTDFQVKAQRHTEKISIHTNTFKKTPSHSNQ